MPERIVLDFEKSDSSLSDINICYYLKIPIPTRHRDFCKTYSQNREYEKVFVLI